MKTQLRIASLSLLTILCLMLTVAPAMADTLYSNGPYDGNTNAWGIYGDHAVTNSKNLNSSRSNVYEVDIVYWDASASDLLTTVDMSMGSTPFGTDIFSGTLSGATNVFLGTNQYGYDLYQASFSTQIVPAGTGGDYLTLSNACTTSGCSTDPIYWDENSGVGCTSPGCPSTAYDIPLARFLRKPSR